MNDCLTPVSASLPCHRKTKHFVDFTVTDIILTIISLGIYAVDIVTDLTLGYQYIRDGHFEWGIMTIALCFGPMILTQLISLRWHHVDVGLVTTPTVLLHFSLLGMFHRYIRVLILGVQSRKMDKTITCKQDFLRKLYHYQSDLCLLRLFESFLESAPQLLLQLYIMHELQSWHFWTVACAFGSLVSLAWGIASYARIMRNAREDKDELDWIGLSLQAVWRTGTIVARMTSLVMCASIIHMWFPLALAVHWLAMTVWTVKQKTDLCSTVWEERIYNSVVGVIYCFCFFNLKEGQSRHRAMVFYTVIAVENAACLAIFLQFAEHHVNDEWFHTAAPIIVVTGSLLGHSSQLVYYRWFHPSGPIKAAFQGPQPTQDTSVEEGRGAQSVQPNASPPCTRRSLKHINPGQLKLSGVSLASAVLEPIVTIIEPLEPNPVEETCPPKNKTLKALSDSKLISVACKGQAVLSKSKSDGQLVAAPTLEKKLRELLLLQNEDAGSEVSSICLSVHDYENMPVFNINRTDWGVRHWKSYSDIENSHHDNSISQEKEPFELSIASVSSSDSNRIVATNDSHKISIEEAISQLKSLAVHGSNVYQPGRCDNQNDDASIYECIWLNQMKCCPTTGHNLSTITEESETSSNRSKSSLVQTVETLINTSLCNSTTSVEDRDDDSHLTYVEVSFLSKLGSSQENKSTQRHINHLI